MKVSHQCPKCNSHNVLEVIGSKLNTYQQIPLNKWSVKNAILNRYICTDCGYTEEYVQLNDTFKKWADKQFDQLNRNFGDYV